MNWIHMVYRSETLKIFKNLLYSDLTRWRWKDVCLLDAPPTPKPRGFSNAHVLLAELIQWTAAQTVGFLGARDEAWSLIHELYSLFPPFPIWSASPPAWGTTAYLFFPVSTLASLESIFCFVFKNNGGITQLPCLKSSTGFPLQLKHILPNVGLWDPI